MTQYHRYAAELLGTFALTFGVTMSIQMEFALMTPLVAALVLGLFVYTLGPISGAQFNPAVTIGLWSVGKMKPVDVLGYLVAQFAGAFLALCAGQAIVGQPLSVGAENGLVVGVMEAIGAFFLVFGVASVVAGRVHEHLSGVVIGGSLLLGILMTSGLTNGVLNPAVASGIGSISAMYMLGPLVGGIAAAWAVQWVGGSPKKSVAKAKASANKAPRRTKKTTAKKRKTTKK